MTTPTPADPASATELSQAPQAAERLPLAEPDTLIRPLSLRTLFLRPEWLAPAAVLEHLPLLFWLVEAHRPRGVVTLGEAPETACLALCQAIDRLGLASEALTIGSWGGPGGEAAWSAAQAHHDGRYGGFSRLVRRRLAAARPRLDAALDLLVLDGPAALAAVLPEVAAREGRWRRALSERGVLVLGGVEALEETGEAETADLVDDLCAAHPHFAFRQGEGLLVIGIGAAPGEALARLFAARRDPGASRTVREVFGRLGRAVVDAEAADRARADRAQGQAAPAESAAAPAAAPMGADTQAQAALTEALAEARAETEALRRERRAAEARLGEHERALAAARDEIEALKQHRATAETTAQTAVEPEAQTPARPDPAPDPAAVPTPAPASEPWRETARLTALWAAATRRLDALEKLPRYFRSAQAANARLIGRAVLAVAGAPASGLDPEAPELRHTAERLAASGLLDPEWYAKTHPDVAETGLDPLRHYLVHGAAAGLAPRDLAFGIAPPAASGPSNADLKARAKLIGGSGLFDAEWYAARYPDVAASGLKPLTHYVRLGWQLGRPPGPGFDAVHYLEANPDVARNGLDPLVHFLEHGRAEGRPWRALPEAAGSAPAAQAKAAGGARALEAGTGPGTPAPAPAPAAPRLTGVEELYDLDDRAGLG